MNIMIRLQYAKGSVVEWLLFGCFLHGWCVWPKWLLTYDMTQAALCYPSGRWHLRAVQGLLLCQWLVWREAERSKKCLQTNITSAGDPILGTPSFPLKQEISILAPVCLLLVSPEDAHRPGAEQSGNMGGESRDAITHIKGVVLLTDKRLLIFQLSSEINILSLSPTTTQFVISM